MNAYLYLMKMKWLVALSYRFDVLTSIASNFILMIAGIYLWKTAYRNTDAVA